MSDADKRYLYSTFAGVGMLTVIGGAIWTQPTWLAVVIFAVMWVCYPETAWKQVDGET